MEEQKIVQQEFQQTSGKLPVLNVRDLGLVGFFFRSADNKQIIQFRKDGFTFNRLHPYTSWEEIFPEASRYWKVYAQIASPEEITRIAVRYINRLLLPGPELRFADYLTAPPPLPEAVPDLVSNFISRVGILDPETNISAIITQALEPPMNQTYIPVLLDIDVYRQNLVDSTTENILEKFGKLREMNNRIFFGSLTEKAISLFE